MVKNIYKVKEEEDLKHLTHFGVKGKVNLLIVDFNFERSPEKCSPSEVPQEKSFFEKGEHSSVNPQSDPPTKCSPSENSQSLTQLSKSEHSPLDPKKEKEKVSYNLPKEKEKK